MKHDEKRATGNFGQSAARALYNVRLRYCTKELESEGRLVFASSCIEF